MQKNSFSTLPFLKPAAVVILATTLILAGTGCRSKKVEKSSYDVIIYGATPGGIAMGVRSAREGLDVLMVSHNERIGGMLTSGLGVWDTLYEGYRSPLYNELRQNLFDDYRENYGEDSPEYKTALPGETGHTNGTFEAHVAERLIKKLVERESRITVLLNHYPTEVETSANSMKSVTFREMESVRTKNFKGRYFADCSYEGDLMALAGVEYRVGRESRDEFNEPHAGVVYMEHDRDFVEPDSRKDRTFKRLNIRHFGTHQTRIYPDSTHEGDTNVQAYNMRYYITNDPDNQIEVTRSDNYDAEYLETLEFQTPGSVVKPNDKLGVNRPQLVGFHQQYVEGDWVTRRKVVEEHIRVTRDLIWYVKNDPSAPEKMRELWKDWSLAKDEFVDNNNDPYDIYVREARRMNGSYVYSENDLRLQPDYDRAKLHSDSIGIVEWYMDAHACTWQKSPQGGLHEGKMMLHKETFVGQLPYRTILAPNIDNFLVPVCLSSTHVAWGAIRLEPTWMQIGESAAYAILQSIEDKTPLPEINTETLLRTLSEKRSLITFFNDLYVDQSDSWIPAVQYFGTKGFFESYNARPLETVNIGTLTAWIDSIHNIKSGTHDSEALARQLAEQPMSRDANLKDLEESLTNYPHPKLDIRDPNSPLTRAHACELLYKTL